MKEEEDFDSKFLINSLDDKKSGDQIEEELLPPKFVVKKVENLEDEDDGFETKHKSEQTRSPVSTGHLVNRNRIELMLDEDQIPDVKMMERNFEDEVSIIRDQDRLNSVLKDDEGVKQDGAEETWISSNWILDPSSDANKDLEEVEIKLTELQKSQMNSLFYRPHEWNTMSNLVKDALHEFNTVRKSDATFYAFQNTFPGLDPNDVNLTVLNSWINTKYISELNPEAIIYQLLEKVNAVEHINGKVALDEAIIGRKNVQDYLLITIERAMIELKRVYIEKKLGEFLHPNSSILSNFQSNYDEIIEDSDYRIEAALEALQNKTIIDWQNDPRIFSDTDHTIANSFEVEGVLEILKLIQRDLGISDNNIIGLKEIGRHVKMTDKKGMDVIIYVDHKKFKGFYEGEVKSGMEEHITRSKFTNHNSRVKTSYHIGSKLNKFIKIDADQSKIMDIINDMNIPPEEAILVYSEYYGGLKDMKQLILSHASATKQILQGNYIRGNNNFAEIRGKKMSLPFVGIRESLPGSRFYTSLKFDLPLSHLITELRNIDTDEAFKTFDFLENHHPQVLKKYFEDLGINRSPYIEKGNFDKIKIKNYFRQDFGKIFKIFPDNLFEINSKEGFHKITDLTGVDFHKPPIDLNQNFAHTVQTDIGKITFKSLDLQFAGIRYLGSEYSTETKFENGVLINLNKETIKLPIFIHREVHDKFVQNSINRINEFALVNGFNPIIVPDGTLTNTGSSSKALVDFILKKYIKSQSLTILENGVTGYVLPAIRIPINGGTFAPTQIFIPITGKKIKDINGEPIERSMMGIKQEIEDRMFGSHLQKSNRSVVISFNKAGNRLSYLNTKSSKTLDSMVEAKTGVRYIEKNSDSMFSLGASGKPFRKLHDLDSKENSHKRKMMKRNSISAKLAESATSFINSRNIKMGRINTDLVISEMIRQFSGDKGIRLTAQLKNGVVQPVHFERLLVKYQKTLTSEIPNSKKISHVDLLNLAERFSAATAISQTRSFKTFEEVDGEIKIISENKLSRAFIKGNFSSKAVKIRTWYQDQINLWVNTPKQIKHGYPLSDEFVDSVIENPLFKLIERSSLFWKKTENKFENFYEVFNNVAISFVEYSGIQTDTVDSAILLASKYWSIIFPGNKKGIVGEFPQKFTQVTTE